MPGFFSVSVQTPTRNLPFYGYSEKPPDFSRLLRHALEYGGHILDLNPPGPHGGRSTEGCSKLKRSVDMTSSGKNGLCVISQRHQPCISKDIRPYTLFFSNSQYKEPLKICFISQAYCKRLNQTTKSRKHVAWRCVHMLSSSQHIYNNVKINHHASSNKTRSLRMARVLFVLSILRRRNTLCYQIS